MKDFKSRKMCMLLYPLEDETHRKALEYIRLNFDYALIVHDKDIDGESQLKKSHTHVVLSFPNARHNTSIANELGIGVNYIENCRSLKNALTYLIHYNDDDKYQYSIDEVEGTLLPQLQKELKNDGKDENMKAYELIDYIDTFNGIIDETEFFKHCCEIGMYDVARRSAYILLRLIDKHNHIIAQVDYYNKKHDWDIRDY